MRDLRKIIANAGKCGRIAGGLVLCDNCDNPASKYYARRMWTGCAPCITGTASSFDEKDLIHVEDKPEEVTE